MIELIGNFEFDNKQFFILKKQNTVWFARKDPRKLSLKLTKEELDICKQVYDKITPRKETTTYQTTISFNNKETLIYYDEYTNLNLFLQYVNGKKVVPNKEDLIELNMIYNNVNEFYESKTKNYNNEQRNSKIPNFRKVIRTVANKTIVVLLSASIVFSSLPHITYAQSKDTKDINSNITLVADSNLGNFTEEEIEEQIGLALSKNPYLTDEQKSWIMDDRVVYMVYENRKYIDRNLGDLKKLKIEFVDGIIGQDESVEGKYSRNQNKITLRLFKNGVGELSDRMKHNFYHELTHFFSMNEQSIYRGQANHALYELFVEAFSSAYFVEYNESDDTPFSGYADTLPCAYVLAEIFPREKLAEATFSYSMKPLEEEARTIDEKSGGEKIKKIEYLLGLLHNSQNTTKEERNKWYNETYKTLDELYRKKFPERKKGIETDPTLYEMFRADGLYSPTVPKPDYIPNGRYSTKHRMRGNRFTLAYIGDYELIVEQRVDDEEVPHVVAVEFQPKELRENNIYKPGNENNNNTNSPER